VQSVQDQTATEIAMADLLAAGSLLLTVVTILYSLWYPEIVTASNKNIDRLSANRTDDYKECRKILHWKSLPLGLASVILFLVNLPVAIDIILSGVQWLKDGHSILYQTEEAVKATFIAVITVLLFLACHTIVAAAVLWHHVWRLDPKRGDYN
jgi:hypothetical protein